MENFPSGEFSGWRIFRVEKKMLENIPVGEFSVGESSGHLFKGTHISTFLTCLH